ncbi:MAG: Flp pilus assembly complex ATPase component TadA [Lachnospiraceae bacterium]|nr:Flp pilus assembly complex ATPase component TadA [Lachnospiraceae bacterium]
MAFMNKKVRLGDVMMDEGIITLDQLNQALTKQQETKHKLGETLVELGFASERQIATALSRQLGLELVDPNRVNIRESILNLIKDHTVLKKSLVIPFDFDEYDSRYLKVAMADPMDIKVIDDLTLLTGMQISPCISTSTDILAAIDKYFGNLENQAVAELFAKERAEEEEQYKDEDMTEANAAVENSPVVILVNRIIEQAARQRASDIHIEPFETHIRVRYRIDGVLKNSGDYKINMLSAVNTRIKIIGGMDISEKRKPQDGRITSIVDKVEYDIRVSMLPTVYGEKTVMRLTIKKALQRDKRNLGFDEQELGTFERIFSNPNGIILVTGPTGSGKSTTLYTALSELNKEDVNIITVEDPVEANIEGINQVQTNVKAGLTFASALRSILRQDPDIIMIGEIRDKETASIAVTASITGHLVVSTLHTNSSAASITRLADMGLEYYLIADSVVGVIAQRLVRRLCPACRQERLATDREKRILGCEGEADVKVWEPKGCPQCGYNGYRGRIGVYELMPISPRIKNIIAGKGTTEAIEKAALADGMYTLQMACSKHVRNAVTSINELKRIVYAGDDVDDVEATSK